MARSRSDRLLSLINAPPIVAARHWEDTDPAGHLPPRSGGSRGSGRSTPRVYRSRGVFSRFAPCRRRSRVRCVFWGSNPQTPSRGEPRTPARSAVVWLGWACFLLGGLRPPRSPSSPRSASLSSRPLALPCRLLAPSGPRKVLPRRVNRALKRDLRTTQTPPCTPIRSQNTDGGAGSRHAFPP